MNKELVCPFCQQELTVYEYSAFTNVGFLPCEKCKIEGTKEMWEALIHTRKALEIIKKEMSKETMPDFAVIHNALKMAEQKETK